MLDSHPRPTSSDLPAQRRARRAQPYTPSSSSSSLRTLDVSLSPPILRSDSQQTVLRLDELASTSNSPNSGSSSVGERTPAPTTHTIALQRGSACLTCRRRKLKCDASESDTSLNRYPIDTHGFLDIETSPHAHPTGRSQTCTYDDGLPKSRVQVLTSKVRDLEEKILAMETTRNGSPPNLAHQGQLTPASSTDALPYLPMIATGDAVFDLLSPPKTPQDLDIWHSLATGDNDIVNLAANLSTFPTQTIPYPQQAALDTVRKLTPWWEQEEVPSGIQLRLINIFLPRKWEPGTEVDEQRLRASLSQPSASQPHPCFLNAIYLVACSFSGDKVLEDLEHVFLAKTRKSMELSLVSGDRLIDFIRASSLLSFYYYSKGRLLEGHHLSSTTARFMIACGLHRMSAARWKPQSDYGYIDTVDAGGGYQNTMLRDLDGPSLIPRPRDIIERNEYVHAFWQVYMNDLGGGLVTGLPISVADSEITTSWPGRLTDDTFLAQSGRQTVLQFYSGLPSTADVSQDRHSQALRIKTMCLLGRAARLSLAKEAARYPDPNLDSKHASCERAIAECMRTLPQDLEQVLGYEGSVALMVARATLLAAMIQLHAPLAMDHPVSRKKALKAANESVQVLRTLRQNYYPVPGGILLLFGLDWAVVREFFVNEHVRLTVEGDQASADVIEGYIHEIEAEMMKLPTRFSSIKAVMSSTTGKSA
ncbi:Fungal specific transcription factor domain [Ceratobasidium sp. AG-Ba]|nr:Fungal specific transcription factor domain [Ceratobasidium sp. AG-Ba]